MAMPNYLNNFTENVLFIASKLNITLTKKSSKRNISKTVTNNNRNCNNAKSNGNKKLTRHHTLEEWKALTEEEHTKVRNARQAAKKEREKRGKQQGKTKRNVAAIISYVVIGRSVIYDKNANALWNLINRVVILNFKNHRLATDPGWGESLQRIHLGRTRKEDVEKINTFVDHYMPS
jgi:hypothetical protein